MSRFVTDGRRHAAMLSPLQQYTLAWTAALIAAGALGAPRPAHAQEGVLEAKVSAIQAEREWIHVPVNKSVLIETSIPVMRLQTLSPEIAQVQSISPTQVLVTGQSFGRTQVIIWSGDGQQKVFDVSVELELDLLNEAIKRVDPMAQINAYPVMETVMLTGTVTDADAAERIMQIASIFAPSVQNHLQIAGEQQVLLSVVVAEMAKSAVRQLGINGYMFGENVRDFPVVSNIGGINPSSFTRAVGPVPAEANVPFLQEPVSVSGNTTLSFAFPRVEMQVFLAALNENGLVRILAEPNLVAISGRTASFLAGGEFPVPVPQSGTGAGTTITIEYREFGARLAFTPVVLSNQTIRLNVAPEVSALDFANGVTLEGFRIPGLTSRRAETTVEIGSGQTLMIAGLLQEEIRATASRLPGLGDLPVLGALFRSVDYRKNLTELAILVTPEIVAPLNPSEVAPLPGDGYEEPNDWQLYVMGMLDANPPTGGPHGLEGDPASDPADAALMGPWGVSDYQENSGGGTSTGP